MAAELDPTPVGGPDDDESSGTPVAERRNRVHWLAGRLLELLDDLTDGGVQIAELSAEETAELVVELRRGINRLEGVHAAALSHAEAVGVAAENAATSAGAWLARETRTPGGAAHRLVKGSRRLVHGPFTATHAALTAGEIDREQALVIVEAVDGLPRSVPTCERARAEAHLLEEAKVFDAPRLRRIGRHLLHVIDPGAADLELAKKVAEEEAAADARTSLTLYDDGKGRCHGTFTIPSLHGDMLRAALEALTSPQRPGALAREAVGPDGDLEVRPRHELMGEALTQLIERYPADRIPQSGGGLATVLVTIPLEKLQEEFATASVDTGHELSGGETRRLACTAGIIPQVLGSASELLDQGRLRRLYTSGQKRAMRSRDKICTVVGCTIPAAWCDAHHKQPWSRGGRTDIRDGTMLCPRHHTMVHRPGYRAEYLPDGSTRVARVRRQ